MARPFSAGEAQALLTKYSVFCAKLRALSKNVEEGAKKQEAVEAVKRLLDQNAFARLAGEEVSSGGVKSVPPTDFDPLILALHEYILAGVYEGRLAPWRRRLAEIELEMMRLKPATRGARWLFASRGTKASAEVGYYHLKDLEKNGCFEQIQALEEEIYRPVDRIAARQSFETEKGRYLSVLRSLADIQRGVPDSRITKLYAREELIAQRADVIRRADAELKEQVKADANAMIGKEALKLLKAAAIEELGRDRPGIRFKVLRERGFETVADVYAATEFNLSSVQGITQETARALKQCAAQYVEQTKQTVKVRLSADNKTPEATKLVVSLFKYRQYAETVGALDSLIKQQQSRISEAISTLKAVDDGSRWFFLEADEKQRYIEAYRKLSALLEGDYAQRVDEAYFYVTGKLRNASAEMAWQDFVRNSIAFFTALEELVPGVLGNSDTRYGLPEELVREIQEECFFPDGLKCTLRRYQEWGVKYILHQERVLLGDEMGLGKTVQAIAAMVSLRNTQATHFIVVCPASVILNWCREIAEKSKLRVTKVHGPDKLKAFKDWQKNGGVAVTNFESTGQLRLELDFQFDMMVVDEAHYIKNAEAQRTKNVLKLGGHTKRLLYMTGTALENKVDEMIALVKMLQPAVAAQLPSISFLSAAPVFREKVAPVYYRRKREDVLTELPELIEYEEMCRMSAEEQRRYEETVLSRNYMEVRRVSWNVDDLSHSSKAKRLEEIVEMAKEDGRKVIVFSYFLSTIEKVSGWLGACCLRAINGSVPPARRQEILDEFDRAPAGAVLPAQIQSGGTGLNIQAASVVVLCEPQFKPSIEKQAISRAYRMGQARNVLVYRLLCVDTVDERIMELLEEKQEIFDAFADRSVAAEAALKEEKQIDEKTFGKIIEEEIQRINARRAAENGAGN